MDMTFQFGGRNVSLSVCAGAERVPCEFQARSTTSDEGGISFLDRGRDGGGSGSAVMEVMAVQHGGSERWWRRHTLIEQGGSNGEGKRTVDDEENGGW
jgi:hypothetical protein